jgi:hypothetical protein
MKQQLNVDTGSIPWYNTSKPMGGLMADKARAIVHGFDVDKSVIEEVDKAVKECAPEDVEFLTLWLRGRKQHEAWTISRGWKAEQYADQQWGVKAKRCSADCLRLREVARLLDLLESDPLTIERMSRGLARRRVRESIHRGGRVGLDAAKMILQRTGEFNKGSSSGAVAPSHPSRPGRRAMERALKEEKERRKKGSGSGSSAG